MICLVCLIALLHSAHFFVSDLLYQLSCRSFVIYVSFVKAEFDEDEDALVIFGKFTLEGDWKIFWSTGRLTVGPEVEIVKK